MKIKLFPLLTVLSLISPTGFAADDNEHTEEWVGLGSGALVGAAIGGPVGAIIGAFAGGIIGKSVADEEALVRQQTLIDSQAQSIAALEHKAQSLNAMVGDYALTRARLTAFESAHDNRLSELTLGMNIQFKTGSADIEPHFHAHLDGVARLMLAEPGLILDIKGFADRRGDADYNLALSQQRLANVTAYLSARGVESDRLQGQAFGASAPLSEGDGWETNFFDRRVTLEFVPVGGTMAANY